MTPRYVVHIVTPDDELAHAFRTNDETDARSAFAGALRRFPTGWYVALWEWPAAAAEPTPGPSRLLAERTIR